MSVLLETSVGDLVVDTLFEQAPAASLNFIKLCKLKYYNDTPFFFVQRSFIARTGNPHPATTSYPPDTSVHALCYPSSSSATTADKYLPATTSSCLTPRITHARWGVVSFTAANADTISRRHGSQKVYASQFFITLADGLSYLDDAGHVIFGNVTEGLSTTLQKLANAAVDGNMQPLRLLRIRHTTILHDPFEDPVGFPVRFRFGAHNNLTDTNVNNGVSDGGPQSPPPCQIVPPDRLPSSSEGDDSDNNDDVNGNNIEQIMARQKELDDETEARARAQVLEMVGDIAHADMKPPENVLFVCKLNSHTDENGLEIIFSRFGPCTVNVIRDAVSGQSLCYAFVEFDTKEMCERAYFKMDNALIDDRFIRVDFSQSVSKLWFHHQNRPRARLQRHQQQQHSLHAAGSDTYPGNDKLQHISLSSPARSQRVQQQRIDNGYEPDDTFRERPKADKRTQPQSTRSKRRRTRFDMR